MRKSHVRPPILLPFPSPATVKAAQLFSPDICAIVSVGQPCPALPSSQVQDVSPGRGGFHPAEVGHSEPSRRGIQPTS